MRIHRLEMQAFGPFAQRQNVDFDELGRHGLFLLNGPTGAGKSSVLDAVCYALYGSVPGARQGAKRLRSDHAPAGLAPEVVCEFSVGGRRLQVRRSPQWERPARRAGGRATTTEQARTLLSERVNGEWVQKSARNDEAAAEIHGLLGMDREQFTRVVMLPQGDFAAFLRSDAKSRRELLQRLFAADRFEEVETSLAAQSLEAARALAQADAERRNVLARVAEEALRHGISAGADAAGSDPGGAADATATDAAATDAADGGDALDGDPNLLRERLEEARDVAVRERGSAERALEAAGASRDEVEARRTQALALQQLETEEAAHAAAGQEVSALELALERYARARILEANLRAVDEAREAADADAAGAGRILEQLRGDPVAVDYVSVSPDATELDASCSRLAAESAVLESGIDEERRFRQLEQAIAEADSGLSRARTGGAEAEKELGRLQQLETEARKEKEVLREAAALAPSARAETESRRRVLEATEKYGRAVKLLHTADTSQLVAQREYLELQEGWLRLLKQRLEQAAAEIAAQLEDGQDCPVCGSTDHPRPAQPVAGGIVTEQQEDTARRAQESAKARLEEARAARDAAALEVAGLEAVGGALDPATALEALQLAEVEDAAARNAERGLHAQEKQLAEVGERIQRLTHERDASRRRIAELEFASAAATEQRDALAGRIEEMRAGHRSIAERAAVLAHAQQAVVAARDALRRSEQAQQGRDLADASLLAALKDSAFDSPAEVREALLEPETARRAQERVAGHHRTGHRLQLERDQPGMAAAIRNRELGIPTPDDVKNARDRAAEAAAEVDASRLRAGLLEQSLQQLTVYEAQLRRHEEALVPLRTRQELVKSVADSVRGAGENAYKMTLSTYVLAARLEQVAEAASERLLAMSDGRYTLVHSDALSGNRKSGLGLNVVDGWTGNSRDTATLSGGESFMASLALALGLADVVQQEAGGTEIETLFVDEGFGSLDEQALEQVMDSLEGLREGGRTVGLVSHVPELKQRIGAQLQVLKGRNGSTLRLVDHLSMV
jgi:exonuclease SbcC